MKSILVPTDFSPAANYVLPIAKELAYKENSRFTMVHTYDGDFTSMLPTYRNFAVHKMNDLVKSSSHAHWPQRCYIREGSMVNCIKHLTKEQAISLVVVGKNSMKENTESEIVFRSASPVLVIPEGALKKLPTHLVYITEKAEEEKCFIAVAEHFCSLLNTQLTILNINNQDVDEVRIDKTQKAFLEWNNKRVPHEYITAEDLLTGLKKYLQYKNPDIVAVAGASGGWLFNSKRKQYLRKLLEYPGLPLLFINAENKNNHRFAFNTKNHETRKKSIQDNSPGRQRIF